MSGEASTPIMTSTPLTPTQPAASAALVRPDSAGLVQPARTSQRKRRRIRTWRSAAATATAAAMLVVAPQVQSSASAAQTLYGWTFTTDAFCDTTLHSISMTSVGMSADGSEATTAYRIAMRFNDGAWSGWTNWKTFTNRSVYYDGPRQLFQGSGLYQFQVQYAVYTTAGWRYSVNEYANHRYSAGGLTGDTGYTSCRV
jgi:hypothetical protein